jgi:hypothetical protein
MRANDRGRAWIVVVLLFIFMVINFADRRRRRWSEEQKRAVVGAAFAPGAVVTEVARRSDVRAGQIYRWRQELATAAPVLPPWW